MVTSIQEKYLQEIYRNLNEEGFTRVTQIAKSLEVSVPTVSKMAKKLNEDELIVFKRYGMITLTEKGMEIGKVLQEKHDCLVKLFRLIGIDEEQIEYGSEKNRISYK